MNKIIILILAAMLLVSCGGKRWSASVIETDLLHAKGVWAENGPENYQYTWRKSCFCPDVREIAVLIEDGQLASAVYVGTNETPPVNQNGYFETIESWFEFIETVIDRNPDGLIIRYNEEYGYPTSIDIDYTTQGVDDEISYFIEEFIGN